MKITFRRIFMAAAAFVAVSMQGCGCDDNDDRYYTPPPGEPSVNVEGATSKGILRGFVVTAHSFDSGALVTQPIATGNTNDFGRYRLAVPSRYRGAPLLIRVTPAESGSTMVCDLPTGCGEVAFGGLLPVLPSSNFRLSAVVPSTDPGEVNITALTDIAAEWTLRQLTATSNADAIRALIASSNSRVANRFGLTGDLLRLPVVDLTNNDTLLATLNGSNNWAVRYAAINAAIVSAVQSDNLTLSVAAALRLFVTEYLDNGGLAGNVSEEAETGFNEILQFSRQLLLIVQARLGDQAPTSLLEIIQRVIAEESFASNEEPDSYDPGTESETAGAQPLAKVKAMVADLRDLAFSFGDTSLSTGGTIGGIADDFAMQIEAAEMVSSEHAAYLMEALGLAATAVDDANRVYSNNSSATSYTSDRGVIVAISATAGVPTFSVDQVIQVEGSDGNVPVTVEWTATNAVTIEEDDEGEGNVVDGRYNVNGSAQSSQLSLLVNEGSTVDVTNMALVEGESESGDLDALDLNLLVTLTQLGVDDPVTLNGSLVVALTDLLVDNSESSGQNGTVETREITVDIASVRVFGDISNSTGESVNFSLSVSGDGTGVSFVDTWVNGWNSSSTGETAETYADLSGNLMFNAELSGIPNAVTLNYGLVRTGLEAANNTLSIKYSGKQFLFRVAVDDGEPVDDLTVTNQDGVVLKIREVTEDGRSRVEGNIVYEGTQYATIDESNVIMVRYTDGSSVSLP